MNTLLTAIRHPFTLRFLAFGLLLFASGPLPGRAQLGDAAPKVDVRLKKLLDDAGVKYKITDSGNFKMEYPVTDGRTQVVIINSVTEKLDTLEVREVWATAYKNRGPISQDIANKLLRQNGKVKLGAWEIDEGEGFTRAIFSAKISANASYASLKTAIEAVYQTADRMEKDLTGKDEF